jgi:uncharacterized protein YecA (UPF0149 family)
MDAIKSTRTPWTAKIPVKKDILGRNDPCPCGSGKKYKNCCGNIGGTADAEQSYVSSL